ncbi:hypothetical protein ED236_09470 [Pseudomethylobacillus aquaticus]|uniref:Uncharacterized protein n=1 Tax=Pseudomethylobacillus aquaticus TaxID=2676064 RepID=A0A3N0UXZ6_9PROT|nr:hypothetical protein [Pseudomethylobacillus aquaticus]ROH85417.1 hypothetical protein ED236_09470 [Pseudomethylobacillus aquaticus]
MDGLVEAFERVVVILAWFVFAYGYVRHLRAGLKNEKVIFSDKLDLLTAMSTLVLWISIRAIFAFAPYDDHADTIFYQWMLLPILCLAFAHQLGQEILTCFHHAATPAEALLTMFYRYAFLVSAFFVILFIFRTDDDGRISNLDMLLKLGWVGALAYFVSRLANAKRVYGEANYQPAPRLLSWLQERLHSAR